MSAEVTATAPVESRPVRVKWLASIVFFGVLPVLVVLLLALEVDDKVAIDLGQFYRAADAILDGRSPYPPGGEPTSEWGGPYPYPPLPALLATPLTLLPIEAAGALVMCLLVAAALGVLYVLGVRDWRCYGVAVMWPPVLSAVQTGNLTLWLALACALTWRFRDRLVPAGTAIGVTLAAKFFLWPFVIWLAATRRLASAVLACVLGVLLLLGSWAVIGFSGLADYPHMLQRLDDLVGDDSYTLYIVGLDAGLPNVAARALWIGVGLVLVGWLVLLARRGDERTAFIIAMAASLALTPIIWLHYFALLLVVVALVQPRLSVVWFVPFGMLITPGSGHPTPFQTAWTLGVAALTFLLAVRASRATGHDLAHTSAEPVVRAA
jgi:Glycosyltransferase family 87